MRPASGSAADGIRQAMASGEYRKALLLWNEYAAGLRDELSRGVPSKGRVQEAGALVEWCRVEALCARARALDKLNRLRVAGRYEDRVAAHSPGSVIGVRC